MHLVLVSVSGHSSVLCNSLRKRYTMASYMVARS